MRQILKLIISKSRLLKPLKMFQQNKIVIFNYHRIRGKNKPIPFDEGVFGPDADRFREELMWIKKETRILSEDELLDIVYHKKKISELCSLVTFDDGYRDNFDIAFPILKELEVPAIFFIPTYQLIERRVGWWDIVAFLLKQHSVKSSNKKFTFLNNEYDNSFPELLIKRINQEIKSMDADVVNLFLENLSRALTIPFPDDLLQSNELMSIKQIKILSDNGMSIGTHSHDHSILSKQDPLTLKRQLLKSIAILENVLSKKINSLAYPVGGYQHFDEITKAVTKDIGLKLGFSYLTGINHCEKIDPFDVKRMRFQPEWINLDMPLAFPGLFFKIKCHS